MLHRASAQPRCLINSLPEEVLERILELAMNDLDRLDHRDAATMRNATLVCKLWLRPARRLLFSYAALRYSGQAVLLSRLLDKTPSLRPLVKKLDSHHLWDDGPLTGLSDLLDVMPGLEALAVSMRQCHPLRNHPVWRQLKTLEVLVDDDEDNSDEIDGEDSELFSLNSTDFPSALQALTIQGSLRPSQNGSDWSKLSFPNVQSLVLTYSKLWRVQERIPENVQLLPSLPQLRIFKAYQCTLDGPGETLLCKIVKEKAKSIEHLVLSHHAFAGSGRLLLCSELLPFLQNLKVLDFQGAATLPLQNTLRSIFPGSLCRLDLHWYNDIDFGFELLHLLADEADVFLPKLQALPNLLFEPKCMIADSPVAEKDGGVTRYQLQELIQLAYRSQISLVRRGIDRRSRASYPNEYDPLSYNIICLPFPHSFKTSVSLLQRSIMEDLESLGILPVESTT